MKVGKKKGGWLFQKTKCLLFLKESKHFRIEHTFCFPKCPTFEEENYGDKCALQLTIY